MADKSTIIWRVVPDEHVRAVHALQRFHAGQERRLTREVRLAGLILLGVLAAAVIGWRWWRTGTPPMEIIFAVGVPALTLGIYSATRPFSVKHAARSQLRDNPLATEERRYIFARGGIKIGGESFEDVITWDEVHRIDETPEFFFIFALKSAYYLPKRAIAWPETLDGLREILHAALDERAKVR